MKKILSFILMLVLLFGVCASVGAAEANTELEQKFYNYCLEVLPEDMKPSEGDNVRVYSVKKIDGVEVFKGDCPWIESTPDSVCKIIGDWCVCSDYTLYPYDLGVYVSSGDEIYTLEQAYEIGLFTDLKPLVGSSYYDCIAIGKNCKYADKVIPAFVDYWGTGVSPYSYDEDYEYYSSDNSADSAEATPDYVLVSLRTYMHYAAPIVYRYGRYMIRNENGMTPYPDGKCIYVPAENKVYALWDAYQQIEGIENIFTEAGLGEPVGDMDEDGKLTVKDATIIQKCIAGLESFPLEDNLYGGSTISITGKFVPFYISDFYCDGERNIKDATAIQKYIAGLEY